MPNYRYLVITPTSEVLENKDLMPLDALRESGVQGEPLLRLAFDQDSKKIYIQDESFRKLLAGGVEHAWAMLNDALRAIEKRYDARFPDRAYGDPPGMTPRKLSDYAEAWGFISGLLKEEFGAEPIDLVVDEYSSDKADEMITFFPRGEAVGSSKPVLMLNRMLNEALRRGPDVSWRALNEALATYYLSNIKEITRAFPDAWKWFSPRLRAWEGRSLHDLFFAVKHDDQVKVFKCPFDDDGELMPPDAIRESIRLPGDQPLMVFAHDVGRKCVILDRMPGRMSGAEKALASGVITKVARGCDMAPSAIIVAFDPLLGKPFVSRLSRYPIVWDFLSEHGATADVPVLEAPIGVKGRAAAMIRSPEEEDDLSPACKRLRATHGIHLKYPFMLVDGRVSSQGRKMRSMIEEFLPDHDGASKTSARDFMIRVSEPENRKNISDYMEFLMDMGLTKPEVLDFFCPRTASLVRRAALRLVLNETIGEKRTILASRSTKTAGWGRELGINDWWHIGLQESRLEASQKEPKRTRRRTFNHSRMMSTPEAYETMLQKGHDKDSKAQKTVEQLLRENQI